MSLEDRVPAVLLGDLTLLRPLAMAGIPVVVAATDGDDPTLRSRYARHTCVLPSLEPERSSEALDALVEEARRIERRHGRRPPLVYGSDESLAFLYRHRPAIEEHFAVLLNDPATAEALLYKHRFAELAAERGVRVPLTVPGDDGRLSKMNDPVIVKPRSKATHDPAVKAFLGASAKARVFSRGRDLVGDPDFESVARRVVVQELIPGSEESLLSFHGIADEYGVPLATFCGRKIRAYPSPAGESSLIELVVDQALEQHGRIVAHLLGLRGPFKIDFIRDPRDGTLHTLEVNARFTLWHHLAAAEGINLPAVAYHYLLEGTRPAATTCVPRHRYIDLYRDYKSFEEHRRRGQLGLYQWLASIVEKPTVHEAFAWDDPVPAMVWLQGEVRRAMKARATRLAQSLGTVLSTW